MTDKIGADVLEDGKEEFPIYPIAIPFKRFQDIEGRVAEYDIIFRNGDSELDDLIEFVDKIFVHRVNIEFTETPSIQTMRTINRIKNCAYVRLKDYQWPSVKELRENDVPFFFDSTIPADSWNELDSMIQMGVSDVYVANDLAYEAEDVIRLCKAKGVQVRCILNRIPLNIRTTGESFKDIVYRPQDIPVLQKYFDVFEFECGENYDWHVFNVLFKAYFVNKHWHGNLAEINPDIKFEGGFPNDYVPNWLNHFRLKCGVSCKRKEKAYCKKCQQAEEMSRILIAKGVGFK